MTINVVALVLGLVVWLLAPNPKVQEAGRLVFFAASLALLLSQGSHRLL